MRVAVQVIAWIYLILGISSGFWLVYATLFGVSGGDFGGAVIAVLLGYGLLKWHPLARRVAVLLSLCSTIICVIGGALCLGHLAGWTVAAQGLIVDHPGRAFVLLGVGLAFAGSQLWILTRPEVASQFESSTSR
ncbi:MAG TPA: hypothetical protein VFG04_08710 [Planctomycetaceae bacterium]|jgi:hypothetical protein|nr:hypothetical protein [Planctomycetaceae bacterium]